MPVSSRITVAGPPVDGMEEILTPAALTFLADLHDRFAPRRDELLALRQVRRDAIAVGEPMDFLHETAEIRDGDWTVAPIPAYLADRRVEITGPTDRKMTINALNSGAKIWLADLEDANTPAWAQCHRRAGQPARGDPPDHRARPGRQVVPAERR